MRSITISDTENSEIVSFERKSNSTVRKFLLKKSSLMDGVYNMDGMNALTHEAQILPQGCRYVRRTQDSTYFIIENGPKVRNTKFSSSRMNHWEKGFTEFTGQKVESKEIFRLSFPYVIFMIAIGKNNKSVNNISVFFRKQPLISLCDNVYLPWLLNISGDSSMCMGKVTIGNTTVESINNVVNSFWTKKYNFDITETHRAYENNKEQNYSFILNPFIWEFYSAKNPAFWMNMDMLSPNLCYDDSCTHKITLGHILNRNSVLNSKISMKPYFFNVLKTDKSNTQYITTEKQDVYSQGNYIHIGDKLIENKTKRTIVILNILSKYGRDYDSETLIANIMYEDTKEEILISKEDMFNNFSNSPIEIIHNNKVIKSNDILISLTKAREYGVVSVVSKIYPSILKDVNEKRCRVKSFPSSSIKSYIDNLINPFVVQDASHFLEVIGDSLLDKWLNIPKKPKHDIAIITTSSLFSVDLIKQAFDKKTLKTLSKFLLAKSEDHINMDEYVDLPLCIEGNGVVNVIYDDYLLMPVIVPFIDNIVDKGQFTAIVAEKPITYSVGDIVLVPNQDNMTDSFVQRTIKEFRKQVCDDESISLYAVLTDVDGNECEVELFNTVYGSFLPSIRKVKTTLSEEEIEYISKLYKWGDKPIFSKYFEGNKVYAPVAILSDFDDGSDTSILFSNFTILSWDNRNYLIEAKLDDNESITIGLPDPFRPQIVPFINRGEYKLINGFVGREERNGEEITVFCFDCSNSGDTVKHLISIKEYNKRYKLLTFIEVEKLSSPSTEARLMFFFNGRLTHSKQTTLPINKSFMMSNYLGDK